MNQLEQEWLSEHFDEEMCFYLKDKKMHHLKYKKKVILIKHFKKALRKHFDEEMCSYLTDKKMHHLKYKKKVTC